MIAFRIIVGVMLLTLMASCAKPSAAKDMTRLNMQWADLMPMDSEYGQLEQAQRLVVDVETFINTHPDSEEAAKLVSGQTPVASLTYPILKQFILERESDYRMAHSLSLFLAKTAFLTGFSAEFLEFEQLALSPHLKKDNIERVKKLLQHNSIKQNSYTPDLLAQLRLKPEYAKIVDSYASSQSIELPDVTYVHSVIAEPARLQCDDDTSLEDKERHLAELKLRLDAKPSPEEKYEILSEMLPLLGELRSSQEAWSTLAIHREAGFAVNTWTPGSGTIILDAQICADRYSDVVKKVERSAGEYKIKIAARLCQKDQFDNAYNYITDAEKHHPSQYLKNIHYVIHALIARGDLYNVKLILENALNLINRGEIDSTAQGIFLSNAAKLCLSGAHLVCTAFVQSAPIIDWKPSYFTEGVGIDLGKLCITPVI